jgi:hypothetical protein
VEDRSAHVGLAAFEGRNGVADDQPKNGVIG